MVVLLASASASASGCTGEPARSDAAPLRGSARTSSDADSTVAGMLDRAGEAYRQAEYDTARVLYQRVLEAAGGRGDSTTVALTLTSLGNTLRWLGDHRQARRHGEAALELKLRLGLRKHLFDSYNSLGLLALSSDRLQEARELFARAFELSRESHDTVRAKVANNLGLVLTDFGRFAEARRFFLEAAQAGRTFENRRIEGRALNNLAVLENEVGRPQAALPFLVRAGELLGADPQGEVNRLGQMGTVSAALGDPGRGIAWLDSALKVSRRLGLKEEIATNLEQLSDLHWLAGDHRRALTLLHEAAELNRELDRTVYLGIDLRREAEIDAAVGDRRTALEKAEQARTVHREAGARAEELADVLLLAELAAEDGGRARAQRYLSDAEPLAFQGENRRARVGFALAAARVALRTGEHRRALAALERAAMDLAVEDHEVLWQVEQVRSLAHAAAGNLDAAAAAGRRASLSVERVRGSFASPALRSSYLVRREAVFADLVDVLLRQGRISEAFEVADAGRGRTLQEYLAANPSRSGAEPDGPTVRELGEEAARLLGRSDSLATLLRETDAEADPTRRTELELERGQLARELARARSAHEAALIRAAERTGGRNALAGARAAASEIQAALHPEEALLAFLVTPGRVRVFIARRDTVLTAAAEVDRQSLLAKVRIARDFASRPPPAGSTTAGAAALGDLHRLVIAPAIGTGLLEGIRRLILVPHAELQYLPFAALRNPGSGHYLVEDYTLIHLPSAGALPALRAARSPTPAQPGTVAFAPFPDRLPGTDREVKALNRARRDVRVRRGRSATEGALREALARSDVVHVASHATLNSLNPLFSQVELAPGRGTRSADDGRLEVHEVIGLSTQSRLVFLSGCETGAGGAWATGYDRGEDFSTLARAFLYAGASNVVATLWRIEDDGAAEFAAAFYRAPAPATPAEALAGTQRAMIRHPRYGAPFYWAAYRLDGGG